MARDVVSPPDRRDREERYLATLRAAIDRIIPPDDFPGAWEAGAGEYIQRQLAGDPHHLATLFYAGLAALDAEAACLFARPFAALTPDEQDRLLGLVAAGEVHTPWPDKPEEFFELLVRLTNEGYYADPGNGGNRDEVAWRMIGYATRVPGTTQR